MTSTDDRQPAPGTRSIQEPMTKNILHTGRELKEESLVVGAGSKEERETTITATSAKEITGSDKGGEACDGLLVEEPLVPVSHVAGQGS